MASIRGVVQTQNPLALDIGWTYRRPEDELDHIASSSLEATRVKDIPAIANLDGVDRRESRAGEEGATSQDLSKLHGC